MQNTFFLNSFNFDFIQKKADHSGSQFTLLFCRCVQLWEPDKENLFTKSGESWETLLYQLRSLLLESFGRYLDKFEEKIRSMREKYANPDWPFVDYFLVHVSIVLLICFTNFFQILYLYLCISWLFHIKYETLLCLC